VNEDLTRAMFEQVQRQRLGEINAEPGSREALEAQYGEVWDTQQLQELFTVHAFAAPFVEVTRKADGAHGAVEFQHHPRFYFSFIRADEEG